MAPPQQLRQQTSNCSLLLIYRPQKDERLSWPCWLTYSRWFTHISGHPSATGRAQDSESTLARDQRSTTGPCHQLVYSGCNQNTWAVSPEFVSTAEFYMLCLKNISHLTSYNIDTHDPITLVFGRSVTKKVRNQTMLCFPTSPI